MLLLVFEFSWLWAGLISFWLFATFLVYYYNILFRTWINSRLTLGFFYVLLFVSFSVVCVWVSVFVWWLKISKTIWDDRIKSFCCWERYHSSAEGELFFCACMYVYIYIYVRNILDRVESVVMMRVPLPSSIYTIFFFSIYLKIKK